MYVEGTRQSYGDDMKTLPLRPLTPLSAKNAPETSAPTSVSAPPAPQATTSAPVEDGETAPAAPESTRGVIRNLEAGHYRGVADVRLRINFAEELQARDAEKTQTGLVEGTTSIQAGIQVRIEAFTASTTLAEGDLETLGAAQDAFSSRIAELLGGESGGQVAADVFAELRSTFEDFVNALLPPVETDGGESIALGGAGEILEPEATVSPGASAPATTEAISEEDVFQALRESLNEFFEEALANLQSFVGGFGLPELSEPQGNGVAYERFLAVYNDLYGQGASGSETALDTTT